MADLTDEWIAKVLRDVEDRMSEFGAGMLMPKGAILKLLQEVQSARRFRAVSGWERWPTPEEFAPMEKAQAEHLEHLRARASLLAGEPEKSV